MRVQAIQIEIGIAIEIEPSWLWDTRRPKPDRSPSRSAGPGGFTLALFAPSDLSYHSLSRLLSVHPLDRLRLYLIIRPCA